MIVQRNFTSSSYNKNANWNISISINVDVGYGSKAVSIKTYNFAFEDIWWFKSDLLKLLVVQICLCQCGWFMQAKVTGRYEAQIPLKILHVETKLIWIQIKDS